MGRPWSHPFSAIAGSVAFTRFASEVGVSVGELAPRRLAIHAAIDEAIIAWRRESPFSMAGTGSGSSSLARFTGSVAPLLRFCFPRQRSLAASRDVREMPAPACVPLRRWPVSRSRFPGSHRARASSMRFSAFEIRRVQSGVWRHVKCFPFGSTLLIMRAPSPQGRRSKRRGVTVMSADATIARDSADLPRRTASIGSSSVCGSCAAGPFCDAAFRYPQLLRTARPGRTSAADCSASSPHSAALGVRCALRSFVPFTGRHSRFRAPDPRAV